MLDFNFSVNHLVSVLAIASGILYAFQIGTLKKNKSIETKYFTTFISVLSFIVLLFLIIDFRLNIKILNLSIVFFILSSVLLLPPLMWLYVKKIISQEDKVKDKVHFYPSIIVSLIVLVLLIAFFLTKNQFFMSILIKVAFLSLVVVFILQNIYYIYLSIKGYLRHREKIEETYSYSEDVDLSWVKVLIIGYVTFIAGIIVVNYFDGEISNIFFNLIILVYIIYIGHNAMKQDSISVLDGKNISDSDYQKDKNISEAQAKIFDKIKADLLDVMVEEKPYLDHNLNIFTLAKRLNTNSKYLSQVINQEFNKSFVHFINEYRIEDAKQILLAKNNYTIEAQSQMVGFKSKSSFNIAFKRHTGLTPSLYIQGNS